MGGTDDVFNVCISDGVDGAYKMRRRGKDGDGRKSTRGGGESRNMGNRVSFSYSFLVAVANFIAGIVFCMRT